MKNLVIRGFYGNGNCGDEAMLQTFYQYFSDEFRIVVSVNNAANVVGKIQKAGVYPYDNTDICWSTDRSIIGSSETAGFLLGGGGLGMGFGWDQYMFAWMHQKKLIHTGVHITGEFYRSDNPAFNQVSTNFLRAAHFFSVRHRLSQEMCKKLHVNARYVPDWAFALNEEATELPAPEKKYIVVVPRYYANVDTSRAREIFDEVRIYAQKRDLKLVIMPFDGSDAKMANQMGLEGTFSEEVYFTPQRAKFIIRNAHAVFSLGRYHPIVYALSGNVPVFSIDLLRAHASDDKTCLQLTEEGLEDFHYPISRKAEFKYDAIKDQIDNFYSDQYRKDFLAYRTALDRNADEIRNILHSS